MYYIDHTCKLLMQFHTKRRATYIQYCFGLHTLGLRIYITNTQLHTYDIHTVFHTKRRATYIQYYFGLHTLDVCIYIANGQLNTYDIDMGHIHRQYGSRIYLFSQIHKGGIYKNCVCITQDIAYNTYVFTHQTAMYIHTMMIWILT